MQNLVASANVVGIEGVVAVRVVGTIHGRAWKIWAVDIVLIEAGEIVELSLVREQVPVIETCI